MKQVFFNASFLFPREVLMNKRGILFLIIACVPAVSVRSSERESLQVMKIVLSDGSQLAACFSDPFIPFEAPYGKLKLPSAMIRSVAFTEKREQSQVVMCNDDRLTGQIEAKQVQVASALGSITIPWKAMVSATPHPDVSEAAEIHYNPQPSRPFLFEITLKDSSYLLGSPEKMAAEFYTLTGKHRLPWKLVRYIRFEEDNETCNVTLWNGDLLKGCINWRAFSVATGLGAVHISTVNTRSIDVSLGGIDLVNKTYTKAEGNRHFMGAVKNNQEKRIGGRMVPPTHFIEAHASGRIEYEFEHPIQEFHAILTMYESYGAHKGNVVFSVETEHGRIFRSRPVHNLHRLPVYLKFKPSKKLVLITDQNGSDHEDWSVWLRPEVR